MSLRLLGIALAPCLLFLPGPVRAQAVDAAADVAARATEGAKLLTSGSPSDRAMAGFLKPNITFTEEDDETSISLAFSFDLQNYTPKLLKKEKQGGANFYRVSRTKISVVASAPIEQGGKQLASLFAGDSLIGGAKVKIALSNLSSTLGDGTGAYEYIAEAYKACIDTEYAEWAKTQRATGAAVPAGYLDSVAAEVARYRDYQVALEKLEQENGKNSVDAYLVQRCVPGNAPRMFSNSGELVRAYTAHEKEYMALFLRDSWTRFMGVDASVGQDDYTYLDSAAFETPEVSRTSWEVGAYVGWINPASTFSIRGRALYGRSWKLPDETEICETFGSPPEQHCLSGPAGPPERVETGLFSLEARQLVTIDETTRIGIAPQVTYRLEDNVVGVEVPVYLSPDKDGKLTGGLKFAYSSKGDNFGVGVFVGVPFSIFY